MRDESEGFDEGAATEPPPCAPERLEELLRQLDKTVRLHQLYPATNPTYLKTLEALRAAFREVWAETDSFTLQVSETRFTCGNAVVMDEPEKASDSLPWTLFKDGVRQLRLSDGFEEHEVERLLAIIPKVRRALDFEDDVVTLLWAADFEHLSYRYIDTVSSEGVPLDPSATPGRWPATAATFADTREVVEAARHRQADTRGALEGMLRVAVTPDVAAQQARADAMRHLREGMDREYAADLRRDVTDVLLDIFELRREEDVRLETARHLDTLLMLHVGTRSFDALAHLLRESAVAVGRAPALTDAARGAMAQLGARLSDPALLAPLLEWIEDAPTPPSAAHVGELLASLHPPALGPMLQWAAASRHYELRQLYAASAERLADAAPHELIGLITAEVEAVALEAIRRCGTHRHDTAVPMLVRALGHADEPRRAAAVAALSNIGTPRAYSGVERALSDTSVAIRTSALRILTVAAHRPVLGRVTEVVQGREVRDMDAAERRALFELYGTLCGDAGVPWLSGQLTGPSGFFKRKTDPETRACSAAALGRVGTPAAREALRKAADTDEPLVRQAVRAALARGGGA